MIACNIAKAMTTNVACSNRFSGFPPSIAKAMTTNVFSIHFSEHKRRCHVRVP